MSKSTVLDVEALIQDIENLDGDHELLVYNNDITPFVVVVITLMGALNCPSDYAVYCANMIHTTGSHVVITADYGFCYQVSEALKNIQVESKIIPVQSQ